MLDETRTTGREGVSELSNPLKIKDLSAQDRELVELIRRTAQGDEEALGMLYDKTGSYVYGLGFRVLGDTTMAEEVTMDVFLQVWRQAGQFDHSRGTPMVWLAVLTRSRAIDRLRIGKKDREAREPMEKVASEPDVECDPEQSSVYLEQCRIVRQAINSLPSEQREMIELTYFGGLSQREIASQVGEPLGTVKTRVRLGMIKLRHVLGPLEEGLIP
ncbi:MAG: sigma-70 family RNA polymerase sigma factor [Nitrospirales bacterium]|nr:sigma-70 family RNA polymerase sigma factor [Nitrospirales bacterium]